MVLWEDASARGGWHSVEELGLVKIATVGYLVNETDTHITIAASIEVGGGMVASNTIPKAWIQERKDIKIPAVNRGQQKKSKKAKSKRSTKSKTK